MATFALGVTGGIGSGKTTVCRMLEELGAEVFYADAEAKRIMHEDASVRAAIVEAFGSESYDAEGRLDRAHLAEVVFADAEGVARINAIVHPAVFAAFDRTLRRASAHGVPLLVHEAALIYESGGDRHLDAVAVVAAPLEVRLERVTKRDGVAPEQVRARMEHQLPQEELVRRADFVLRNDGTNEDLRRRVEDLFRRVTASG